MIVLIPFNWEGQPEHPRKFRYQGLYGASLSFFIADAVKKVNKPLLLVTRNVQEALGLEQELRWLLPNTTVMYFPDWETLPYDSFSTYQDIISRRLEILSKMATSKNLVVIATGNTLMGRVAPKSFIDREAMIFKKGDHVSIEKLRERLSNAGYLLTRQVLEHGEFAVRGSIVDLYPMGGNTPYRIDFFDDEIDTISIFDLESQRSIKNSDKIELLPAHEFPITEDATNIFRKKYRDIFNPSDITKHNIYQQISRKNIPAGIEYYLPLFFEETATVFDYLPNDALLFVTEELRPTLDEFWKDIQNRATKYQDTPDHPSLPPDMLYLNPEKLQEKLNNFTSCRIWTSRNLELPKGTTDLKTNQLPPIAINHTDEIPCQKLLDFQSSFSGKILITTASPGRQSIMLDLLQKHLKVTVFAGIQDFYDSDAKTGIIVAPFTTGFLLPNIAVITESELLGASYTEVRRRGRNRTINPDAVIKNLAELKPGELIVHEKHGIGKYQGLTTLEIEGVKTEFVSLLYAADAKMYVPITSLHLLSRYTGSENASLTKLGTNQWEKARKKAAEKIRDVAAGLLDIYAKREIKKGFAFKVPKDEYHRFCAGFGFQPTEDQNKAIAAVLTDMQSDKPMDRLICGDVGFGKTEVAMRAAFVAVSNGKQVAILVPTTLLADQHYESFRDRFAHTPVEIACLSRFKSTKEQKETESKLANGSVDIVIGTHKLLSSSIHFKDLGLLIVDEEHRFGVSQKEKIKKFRSEIDILTMTATPIPRTLNMAMNSIRSLSIIATPPAKRLAVRTFVNEYDENIIREAILRELKRGGQTYYLHNDVMTINSVADTIRRIVPEANVAVAHAQLPERALARVMHDFYHQHNNVLVCSTIIETGIDVPTANTIIIDRADTLGLAQLHQLRGRVGRSHHQAYAYLLTPENAEISADAKKRLKAIASLEELGSGFILATQDLEIRGAGEILGDEQSGQIQSIGFSLYMEMLENVIKALKEGHEITDESLSSNDIEIELHIPVLFPENYIGDVTTRLTLYKRLASTINDEETENLKSEIIDRFGPLPQEAMNLIEIQRIRNTARRLGITALDMNAKSGSINFGEHIHIDFDYLRELIMQPNSKFRMDGPNRIRILENIPDSKKRIPFIKEILDEFNKHYV